MGALYFNTNQTSEALEATRDQIGLTRDQIGLSEQGQLTDRFGKAVEQLGTKDSLEVRLGGIYALERLARDSVRDHPTIMEVLSAYVREHAPLSLCSDTEPLVRPATDVQAILTVIARRDRNRDRNALALNNTCLFGANLTGADLTDAYLFEAYLFEAYLSRADLADADLSRADLTNAYLPGAYLSRANLADADLTGANLTGANLTGANLTDAYLFGADLTRTRGR